MDTTSKLLDPALQMQWDYDSEADVLYMSIGEPQPTLSVDISEGLILRYDEAQSAIVGLTIIGLKTRLEQTQELVPNFANEVEDNARQQANQHNHPATKQNLSEAVREIKAIFAELDQQYDKTTPSGNAMITAKAVEAIESKPTLKQRLLNAAKEGGIATIEVAVDHPAIKPVVAAFKGFTNP